MIKETIQLRKRKMSLSISNSKINAVFRSDIVKTGLRIYNNGFIGISGAIGSYDENDLLQKAKHILNFKLPYDCQPTADITRSEDLSNRCDLTDEKFIELSNKLLDILSVKYPNFMFGNKIFFNEEEMTLKNELGTNLYHKDKYIFAEFLIKHRDSNNLFDSFGFYQSRKFNLEEAVNAITETCDAYEEKIDIENKKIPVILLLDQHTFLGKFMDDLSAREFASNASLFSGKLGQKLFDDKFSLFINRNSVENYGCFFDGEGTTLINDKFTLIEKGVLQSPYSAKKQAKQFGFPLTASASLEYDSVPNTSPEGIEIASSEKTIKELLRGRKAIYVVSASGGDFTSQGEYASPAQAAYIFDGEKILGRLPQISISSNIYDMFGKDFIGLSTNGNSSNCPVKFLAVEMNVRKIDGWL